jgi:group I intron endonuclease
MKEKVCGIYEILNIINNKKYIGQSTDIYARWEAHKNQLRRRCHFNDRLQNAWDKYGGDAFRFHILEICPTDSLDEKECFYIDKYETIDCHKGYNLKQGGSGDQVSDESKIKMSESQKKRWTEELRQELSLKYSGKDNPFYGKHHTEETGRKIAEANKKREWLEESKKKTSEALKGRKPWNTGKTIPQDIKDKISHTLKGRPSPHKKAVVQLTTDSQYIATFDSMAEAMLKTGVNSAYISKCCRGTSKTAGGFKWIYTDKYFLNCTEKSEGELLCS